MGHHNSKHSKVSVSSNKSKHSKAKKSSDSSDKNEDKSTTDHNNHQSPSRSHKKSDSQSPNRNKSKVNTKIRNVSSRFTMRRQKLKFHMNKAEEFSLTETEVKNLKHMILSATQNSGERLTESILFQCPHARTVFDLWHADNVRSGWYDMSTHHDKMQTQMNAVIKKLDKPEEAAQMLQQIGIKHAEYVKYGFEETMFTRFGEAMVHQAVHWGTHRRARRMRNNLYNVVLFISGQMQQGFEEATHERKLIKKSRILSSAIDLTCKDTDSLRSGSPGPLPSGQPGRIVKSRLMRKRSNSYTYGNCDIGRLNIGNK